MKTKLALKVVGLIGVLALISAGYCFWLMTVPLSYDWVYAVVIGFVVSIGVFVISLYMDRRLGPGRSRISHRD